MREVAAELAAYLRMVDVRMLLMAFVVLPGGIYIFVLAYKSWNDFLSEQLKVKGTGFDTNLKFINGFIGSSHRLIIFIFVWQIIIIILFSIIPINFLESRPFERFL